MRREPIAVDVAMELNAGTDPRAPGGEVTAELCGHWDHDGPCRWPHNTQIDAGAHPARLRTVVVVSDQDRDEVLQRIETALRRDDRWQIVHLELVSITVEEQALAARLAR